VATRCSDHKRDGTPCRAWAVPGTDPPRCSAHSGKTGGAPKGNQNARKHGGYAEPAGPSTSLERELEILTRQIEDVREYAQTRREELEPAEYRKHNALLGALISRKGRLLRDRRALSGEDADELSRMFEDAARRLAAEKGWHD
jgi:hypothetical protein